jgi:hypothetical protein
METKELIYTAVIAFGFTVVREVIDLVNCCSDLDGLHNSFDHLDMTSHMQCLEMLFI